VTYRDEIINGMGALADDPNTVVYGYNCRYGSRAYGTLAKVHSSMIIEMPVAEALMAGVAIGAALVGKKPILFFERQDFILLALDQIINHLGLIRDLSHGEYDPHIIIRAVVGGTKPFNAGLQHSKRLIDMVKHRIHGEVYEPVTARDVRDTYRTAIEKRSEQTTIISETRDLYDTIG